MPDPWANSLSTLTISRDERPLGQLVWWLMFLGWTPILASYGYVLDPIATLETGAIATFTNEVTLYQQRGFGHPALGILTLATLLQALAIRRLRWRTLWPIPVFLGLSCFIYVFNAPSSASASESGVHAMYAVFATWSAYLFLRHGHLMSAGFGGYIALLFIDVVLHWFGMDGGLLGLVFYGYVPSLITTAIFLALTVLIRMAWLMVRDNRAFIQSLDRATFRLALRRTLLLWWPMPIVFVLFGFAWWAAAQYWVKPKTLAVVTQQSQATESALQAWIETEQAKPALPAKQQGFLEKFQTYAHEVARLRRQILKEQRRSGHIPGVFSSNELREYQDALDALRRDFQAPPSHAPEIARKALLQQSIESYAAWKAAPETSEDPLERQMRRLTELQTMLTGAQTQLAIILASQKSDSLEALPETARREIDQELFPRSALPLVNVPKCFVIEFLDPVCAVEARMARGANSAMTGLREDMIDAVVESIEGPATEGAKSVDEAMLKALAEAQTQFDGFETRSVSAIKQGFQTWRNVSLLATLYSLIILFKTLLIVFSRVIFSPKVAPNLAAPFLPETPTDGLPQLTRHAQILRIPVDDPDAHFVSRWGVTLEGPPPARRRPMGLRFPVIRMLTRNWSMNRIDGRRNPDDYEFDAHLKVDEPAELVSWRLREGEQVVFRFQDFVGMGETVKVRRVASLSITTLILGRMIYYVAEGPGVLILRTTAAARISSDPEAHRPAPMPKLVAWAAHTCFGILAAQTTTDTFLSGYNLKTGDKDTVIWDTSTRRGNGPGTGILRFAKSFLLPI
ncbi:hypothetical protein [Thiosocius teredinicola]|uniref:hypothetical protein n=1 Tax=Thiosocius teredinicola TaxID=1973002 RepID=UPI000F7AD08D